MRHSDRNPNSPKICVQTLKQWLRVREEISRFLSSNCEARVLDGMEMAIDMARSQLVREKGRARYVREMVGRELKRLPPAGGIRVLFKSGDTAKLSGEQDPVQQILRLEAMKGSWAVSLFVGNRQLFL